MLETQTDSSRERSELETAMWKLWANELYFKQRDRQGACEEGEELMEQMQSSKRDRSSNETEKGRGQ